MVKSHEVLALKLEFAHEPEVDKGLPYVVIEFLEQFERLPQMRSGFIMKAESSTSATEEAVGVGLPDVSVPPSGGLWG